MTDNANVWDPNVTSVSNYGKILLLECPLTTISNDATEQELAVVTIPANTVPPVSKLRVTLTGYFVNNDINGRYFGVGLGLNAVQIVGATQTLGAMNTSPNHHPHRLVFDIDINVGGVTLVTGVSELGDPGITPSWIDITAPPAGSHKILKTNASGFNTTVDATLALTLKLSAAHAAVIYSVTCVMIQHFYKRP